MQIKDNRSNTYSSNDEYKNSKFNELSLDTSL
jgi:hypothetical protein